MSNKEFHGATAHYRFSARPPSSVAPPAASAASAGGYRQISAMNVRHHADGMKLYIPQVELMILGLATSVEDLAKQELRRVAQRPSCCIDAFGQVYESYGDQWNPLQIEHDSGSGRAFYGFQIGDGGRFKLWVLRALYLAFIEDYIPRGCRVEPRDDNHANCRLDNLVLKVCQDEIDKHHLN